MRPPLELEACIQNDFCGATPRYLRECFGKLSVAYRGWRQERALYQDLPLRNPRLANRIAALSSEHARLASELDELVATVGHLSEVPDKPLRLRMVALVQDLRRLEHAEIALLQSAYWRENGVGD